MYIPIQCKERRYKSFFYRQGQTGHKKYAFLRDENVYSNMIQIIQIYIQIPQNNDNVY